MLCEFTWSDDALYLGIIQRHGYKPHEKHTAVSEQSPLEFQLLQHIFGKEGFVPSSRFDPDRRWLQENLQTSETFEAFIWYPCNMVSLEDQFEKVSISRGEKKYEIQITSMDGEVIPYTKVSMDFFPAGFCQLDETKLKDSYDLDLTSQQDFNQEIIGLLRHADRTVTRRRIHYLDKLIPLLPLTHYEQRLKLERIHPLIRHFLNVEDIYLWNAFVVVIDANQQIPAQIMHRDTLCESVSLFFYLDDPCDPGTAFWPYSHRLTGAIKEGLTSKVCPKLHKGQMIAIHGRMLHQGCESTTSHAQRRVLYVFQYRPVMSRSDRSKSILDADHAIYAGGDTQTSFKVG